MCACKYRSLEHADEETCSIKLVHISNSALSKRDNSPENLQSWKKPPCSAQELVSERVPREVFLQRRPRHQQHAWNLKNDISRVVADVEVVEFVSVEAKVLLESTDVGIANVGLICLCQIGHSIRKVKPT